jgi:hypothetical protein
VPLGGHVRLGTAIYSYDGTIAFGVTGDADAPLRALDLCKGIEAAMAELLASARTAPRRRGDGRAVSAGRTARAR